MDDLVNKVSQIASRDSVSRMHLRDKLAKRRAKKRLASVASQLRKVFSYALYSAHHMRYFRRGKLAVAGNLCLWTFVSMLRYLG